MSQRSSELVEEVVEGLKGLGELAVLSYPKEGERRSVDLVFKNSDGGSVILKVSDDALKVGRQEREELKSLASIMSVNAFIVSNRRDGERLVEGVVYDVDGVKVISVETLLVSVRGYMPVIYEDKDGFKAKINGALLKSRRMERGYSLGELARRLGVSRKSVYEYERGSMTPSLDIVDRLISEFGEDLVVPLNIFNTNEKALSVEFFSRGLPEVDNASEREIAARLASLGFSIAHVKRAPLDLAARATDEKLLLVIDHGKDDVSVFVDKAINAKKLARAARGGRLLVVSDRPSKSAIELELDETVFSTSELLRVIRESAGGAEGLSDNRQAGHR